MLQEDKAPAGGHTDGMWQSSGSTWACEAPEPAAVRLLSVTPKRASQKPRA